MLKFIKENWLIEIISGAIGSIITIVIVYHWYSKNASDVVTSWIVALCTFVLTVFAWWAYQYAIDGYKKQAEINEITKAKMKYKLDLISEIAHTVAQIQIVFIHAQEKCKEAILDVGSNTNEELKLKVKALSKDQNKIAEKIDSHMENLFKEQIKVNIISATFKIPNAKFQNPIMIIADYLEQVKNNIIRDNVLRHKLLEKSISNFNLMEEIKKIKDFHQEESNHIMNLLDQLDESLKNFLNDDLDKYHHDQP